MRIDGVGPAGSTALGGWMLVSACGLLIARERDTGFVVEDFCAFGLVSVCHFVAVVVGEVVIDQSPHLSTGIGPADQRVAYAFAFHVAGVSRSLGAHVMEGWVPGKVGRDVSGKVKGALDCVMKPSTFDGD